MLLDQDPSIRPTEASIALNAAIVIRQITVPAMELNHANHLITVELAKRLATPFGAQAGSRHRGAVRAARQRAKTFWRNKVFPRDQSRSQRDIHPYTMTAMSRSQKCREPSHSCIGRLPSIQKNSTIFRLVFRTVFHPLSDLQRPNATYRYSLLSNLIFEISPPASGVIYRKPKPPDTVLRGVATREETRARRGANLDSLALRGTNFTHAVTNQPVCSPSRAVLLTSRYATENGVWRLGLPMDKSLPTLAGELRKSGYSTNYIGKWHLALEDPKVGGTSGPVTNPEDRGGFLDLWEAANAPENVTFPYHGTFWDRDNQPIIYKDEYRVDFLTDRAERFLRQKHEKPFLLVVSQLEPHQQNSGVNRPVAPKGVAERFANSTVPHDLREFPGSWQAYLPDYYGCVEAIDASVGRIQRILVEEHLADNTIFVFLSDHGCHFQTRNNSDKCTSHQSSIRIPLIIDGLGFRRAQHIHELVGIIDVAPTLLEAVGVLVPSSWKGNSLLPLLHDPEVRGKWPNQQFIQISEVMTARAIHTRD